jgi:nucleoside-diphosphate-sugar epimerase
MQNLNNINAVWHFAASTEFDEEKRPIIELMNKTGTRNLVDIVERLPLEDFFYCSTAYVCGTALPEDVIPEGDFEPRGFKNPYEETKFGCERMIRRSTMPWTILRPSIMIGDSRTKSADGETRMIYGYCLGVYDGVCSVLKQSAADDTDSRKRFWRYWQNVNGNRSNWLDLRGVRVDADPRCTENAVTIDDVVNVFMAVQRDPSRHGKTYNIVNPVPVTMQTLVDSTLTALKARNLVLDPTLVVDKKSPGERLMYKRTSVYRPYVHLKEPIWEMGNTRAVVPDQQRVLMTETLFGQLLEKFFYEIGEKYLSPITADNKYI